MKNPAPAIILFCLLITAAVAQDPQTDTLIRKFDMHRRHALQEKIYMHLSRNFCLTGETLWFKIYAVDGSFHKPLDLSKVAYVEILDPANFPVLQAKIKLENGMGSGSFFIPATLATGNYRIRAYTNWMKNTGAEFFYDQVITISNTFVASDGTPAGAIPEYTVDFFPEAGNIVSGIQCKVAFRITDATGAGIDRKGFVLDDEGDTVARFASEKFGIGSFNITAAHGEKYRAFLNGSKREYTFPQVYPTGITMRLQDSGAYIKVIVRSQGLTAQNVLLFAHARQIIARAERQTLAGGHADFTFEKAQLPEGISHFTLFDESLQPLCERLYFTYPRKNLGIGIETNLKTFSQRKKVTVSLETAARGGDRHTPANLSMSVFRIDSLAAPDASGIFAYLWLRSDLTGKIESPEYYFRNQDPSVVRAMDNLMLTHGWRRFEWKEVLGKPRDPAFLPEVREHIISATVRSTPDTKRGIFTYLGSPGKIIRAYGAWSNVAGEVRFEIKDFYGPRRIILQTKPDTSTVHKITINNPFSTSVDSEKIPPAKIPEKRREELLSRSISMQVQDIYYYETYGSVMIPPPVDSTAFYGKADATYFLDDYTRFPVMEEVMREYVPPVFVRKRRDGFHFLVVDINKGMLQGDPMVLLDGVPVLDADDIMRVDPLRVKKLEVIRRSYYLGQAVFPGIISYTTYAGDLGGLELDPRAVSLDYEGLQLKRQFHKPEYPNAQANYRMPDQRHLLHWEPDITTNEEGKQQVEFFTSDVPGRYGIVVDGLDGDGNAGTTTAFFEVVPSTQ